MSVYPIKYKVLNKETGRKVSVTKWRVQIRKGGEKISKLFDNEGVARSWEEQELHRISTGVPQNLIFDLKYQLEMPDMSALLRDYFNQHMSKHSASSFKTNLNRCLRAIPSIPIYLKDLGPKIDNYRYQNTVVDAMMGRIYKKDHIEFGQFKIDTVDFWLLIAYMDSRRRTGIKNNTILREISMISSAFEKVYKLYPENFPHGLMNPVKMLPKGEKPKPYLGRKRVLSDDEAVQIAEWMKLKANQEPYYLFVTCLESGARKSEVLDAQWENVNLQLWSIHIPKTKNGRPRDIMIPEDDDFREWLKANRLAKGPIFKLTPWNFRQYWVDALKALGLYDDPDTRLHFHDTRRTALTKLIRQKRLNSFQIAKEMGVSPQTVETTVQNMPDRLAEIFAKLRAGHALNEDEIMALAGHGSISMTNVYYGDRN
ncbi:tyrosine-type recombinase/integrase [Acinetobacter sp.]|uniref:tyrosine-type recombinase/integrase n=1 Tax=Acinetobacter sp. TaxID=472 RepID=UPI00388D7A24